MGRTRHFWRVARSRTFRLLYIAISVLCLCLWIFGTALAEPLRDLGLGVKPGDPVTIPADGSSVTHLIVDLDRCSWAGDTSIGTYHLQTSTTLGSISPGFASSLESDPFPPELTLTAGTTTGIATITAKLDYCPEDGVMVFGVCTVRPEFGEWPTCIGIVQVEIVPYTPPSSAESGEDDEEESEEEESKEFSAGVSCSPTSPTVGQTITCTTSVKNAAAGEELNYTWYLESAAGVTTSKPTYSWPAKESGGHSIVVEVLGDNRWTRASVDVNVLEEGEKPAESDTSGDDESSVDDLVKNLKDWLTAGGIKETDPAKVAAGGGAAAVLLATWFIINNRAGVPMEKLEMALGRWRWAQRGSPAVGGGEPPSDVPEGGKIPAKSKKPGSLPEDDKIKPGAGAEAKPKPGAQKDGKVGVKAEGETPPAAQTPDAADAASPKKPVKPAEGESGEEQAQRYVKDWKDIDDAVENTSKGVKEFIDKIPEGLRNSDKWKKLVEPKLKKLQDLLSKLKLDKGRTWLDRVDKLIELRKEAERDLAHLQPDAREAVIWTERTLRVLSNIATDAFKVMVTDRAKDAGNAILPKQAAEKWAKAMDELHKEMEGLGDGISLAVRRGAFNLTRGKSFGEAVDEMKRSSSPVIRQEAQDLENIKSGPRDVPVEYPKFWERGTNKVDELWTRFKKSLPPPPPIKKWLGWK
jgi:hypothetical protein